MTTDSTATASCTTSRSIWGCAAAKCCPSGKDGDRSSHRDQHSRQTHLYAGAGADRASGRHDCPLPAHRARRADDRRLPDLLAGEGAPITLEYLGQTPIALPGPFTMDKLRRLRSSIRYDHLFFASTSRAAAWIGAAGASAQTLSAIISPASATGTAARRRWVHPRWPRLHRPISRRR